MQNKYMSLLGLARRAGRLSMGHDTVMEAVKKKKSKLILFTSDTSERLREEITGEVERHCEEVRIRIIGETMEEIHYLLGYWAGVISVNDINFAVRILELTQQEENAYGD